MGNVKIQREYKIFGKRRGGNVRIPPKSGGNTNFESMTKKGHHKFLWIYRMFLEKGEIGETFLTLKDVLKQLGGI